MARDSRSTVRQQKQKRDKAKMRNEEGGNKDSTLSWRLPLQLLPSWQCCCPPCAILGTSRELMAAALWVSCPAAAPWDSSACRLKPQHRVTFKHVPLLLEPFKAPASNHGGLTLEFHVFKMKMTCLLAFLCIHVSLSILLQKTLWYLCFSVFECMCMHLNHLH